MARKLKEEARIDRFVHLGRSLDLDPSKNV